MECLYCKKTIKDNQKWCSNICKTKWNDKEQAFFVQSGFVTKSADMKETDRQLQAKFIKKMKKSDIREKMPISLGAIS